MKWITWRRWIPALLMAVLAMGGAFAIAPVYAASSTYTVTDCSTGSLSDNASGGFGWAVNQANANAGSTIAFSCAQTATPNIIDATSTITLNQSVAIDGSGQNITFDGQNARTVFDLESSGEVRFTGLTIQHGSPAVYQGNGDFALINSVVANNTGNYGAVESFTGYATWIANSAFLDNAAGSYGGAVTTGRYGELDIQNSTFAQNTAVYSGGALSVTGTTNITGSTFSGNSPNDVLNYSGDEGATTIADSIVPDGTRVYSSVISLPGTLTSAAFAPPITQPIASVQQTVYPLASYGIPGAHVTLSSMLASISNNPVAGPLTDQLDDLRGATTTVGAYDPLGLPSQQFSFQNQRVTLTAGTISETTGNLTALNVTANGFDQTVTGTLPITVIDATGSGAGWHLTIQRTVFMNGSTPAPTITATLTGIAGACSTGSTCTVAANAITGYPIAIPTASPVVFSNAAANTGMGQMLDSAGFSIAIPANVFAATYSSTLTVAVVSGP